LSETISAIEGQSAFVSYVSPTQVNVKIPSGVSAGAQSITVTTAAGTSASYTTDVNSTEPGLAAALFADGTTYVLPSHAASGVTLRPANPGETIILYGVGFGNVTPAVNAGLALDEVGLYQFNVAVPSGLQAGTVPIALTLGGRPGNQVLYTAVGN
jgi:uncharacterized protein (TIGR03437 family)